MTASDSVNDILAKVLENKLPSNFRFIAKGKSSGYLVIPGNGAPRWIVPVNAFLAYDVLSQWNPYGTVSRIKWFLLRLFYRLNLLAIVPGITHLNSLNIRESKVANCSASNTVAPVIYIGTPGPQQKAVVTLVDVNDGEALAVLKIPLGNKAGTSIRSEAEALISLAALNVKQVPELLSHYESSGASLQTMLLGKLAPRELCNKQVSWLLELPRTGKSTTLKEQKERINFMFRQEEFLSPEVESLIVKALGFVSDEGAVPLVLVHGDFAPWNMKNQKNGDLVIIDWEDADFEGLPLWDLCHYNLMQSLVFNDADLLKGIFVNKLYGNYLAKLGVSQGKLKSLVLIYMLFKILDNETHIDYKNFLIDGVSVVIEQ